MPVAPGDGSPAGKPQSAGLAVLGVALAGDLEDRDVQGRLASTEYAGTGVHSHDDGVIHWHPFSSAASGRRARLGVFFDNYGVAVSDDRIELTKGSLIRLDGQPVDDVPLVYDEAGTTCDGEHASLQLVVWDDFCDPDSDMTYRDDFGSIRFDRDGMVIVLAFLPDGVDVVMPEWAGRLPELGAADRNGRVTAGDSECPS